MLYAAPYRRARRRLLRLLLVVSAVCSADVLASPTTAYDSYDSEHHAGLVRQGVETASNGREYHPLHLQHHHLHHRNALSPAASSIEVGRQDVQEAAETLPVQQQQYLAHGGGDSVTRVPWYGLTELSDVLLLAVLVTFAVVGLLLFSVLVLGLRSKLQHFARSTRQQEQQEQPDGFLLPDYADRKKECSSAAKCSVGGSAKLQTKLPAPSLILVETGHVLVRPVPATCVAVTVRDKNSDRETAPRGRRRIEQPLSLSDKRHPSSPSAQSTTTTTTTEVATSVAGKRQSPLPIAATLPTATMSATTVEPANTSSQGPTVSNVEGSSANNDKENCLQQHNSSEHTVEQSQHQQHPVLPTSQRNVLKRQPVAEISLFGPPGTPGPAGSPTTFIQLLTPSSASSLSTSATTTDNNATPTKGASTGGGASGPVLSAAETMAAARFGFSPRSIHSFTVQTATYFRFPDVDDFTPTPRSMRSAAKHHEATESSSTPPAVDACTEEEGVVVSTEKAPAVEPPVVKCELQPASAEAKPAEPAPPEREARPAHRICAPMANRRVRLKSISLDSEGARLVEENLTSTIPVQELVGMAQQRTTGRFDEDDNDDEDDDEDDDDDDPDGNHRQSRNDNDDGGAGGSSNSKHAKRVRNILNLRLNIPPAGSALTTAPLAPPGASQSTGSMAKAAPRTMVTVSGSISNPTMSSTNTTTYPPLQHQHHGMMAVLGVGGAGGQMDESNEQFYFEYYDYGDTDEEDDYDGVDYDEEHEDNNNNRMVGEGTVAVSLPSAPKTPTLSQSKQKASSLDSDKLRLTTATVPYGGTGNVASGAPGGSVSCSGGISHILSIAQSTSGHSMSTLSYPSTQHPREQQSGRQQQQQQQQHHLHGQQQHAQQQLQQPPRRVSSASVPTTPKRYQYRSAVNHHYHHTHHQQQASGQSKLKPSYHPGAAPTTHLSMLVGDGGGGGCGEGEPNRKDKSSVGGHKGTAAGGGTTTTTTTTVALPPSSSSTTIDSMKGGGQQTNEEPGGKSTKDSVTGKVVPTSGRSSILQRRGSNHSLTLNLDVYTRGGSVDLTSSSCSLYRGSYKNLHQVQSHTQLYQQYPDAGSTVRVQCHQASPQQQQGGPLSSASAAGTPHANANNNNNASSKKNLLQRRGSNTSLTLNLRSGLGTGGAGGGGGGGGAGGVGGSAFGLNRFSSHNSLNMTHILLTTHTQNEATGGGMMLEEDELDCTGAGNGGGEGELRRFGSSMDAGMLHGGGGGGGLGCGSERAGVGDGSGVQARAGRSANYGRLTVATMHGTSMDTGSNTSGQQYGGGMMDDTAGRAGASCGARTGGHHYTVGARQRKFRSSDSLHNINSVREHAVLGCERHQHGSDAVDSHHQTEAKMMSVSNYQRSCQSSFDDRHHFGSSENVKDHQSKLSTHRGLFQRDPATVTSTSSANNLSALGTGSLCTCCCCCCCCCCPGGDPMDGGTCCDATGLIVKTGNLSISNSNIRNISTKPLSPQTTSEDFKIYLANIQFLQNASNVLTIAYLRKLHNFFSKTYRRMLSSVSGAGQRRPSKEQQQQQETTEPQGLSGIDGGPKMMLLHSDSLHHPPVCDDETYDEEHKKMVLKIHQEFWDLPTNYQEKPLVFGSQAKNRYKTILPNEHSRVILEAERAVVPSSEPYINANYIKGPDYASNCYIATQGPLPNTIYEFWLMVHQNIIRAATASPASPGSPTGTTAEQAQKIVMLTNFVENGRQKCAVYFPQEEGDWLAFGSTADVDVSDVLEHKAELEAAAGERTENNPTKLRCASGFFLVHNHCVEQRNGYTVRTLTVVYGVRKDTAGVAGSAAGSRTESVDHGDDGDEFELTSFRAHHYWFPDWPDHRSPNDINVLLDLSLDVLGKDGASLSLTGSEREEPSKEVYATRSCASPNGSASRVPTQGSAVLPIIHCSAGIGRTGCLIAILNGLRQLRLSVSAHTKRKQLKRHPQLHPAQICSSLPVAIDDGAEPMPDGTRNAVEVSGVAITDTEPGDGPLPDDDELEQRFPLPPVPGGAVEARINGRGPQLTGAQRGESGQVDILGIVCNLRLQRGGMVQNSEQYELIHRALCLYLEQLTQEGHI
ncbi:hypothetical protein ZHAS_00011049 [Anopheles sinensis]|uniref:Protein-tyrosine-phosphatase n=1 Tax=Anopheles sinensis TaxID=74873 RepID=A0A084VZ73_ANOSI|nr:hypothetical protein ZHAS_00011049 [Anopheles sinensis]